MSDLGFSETELRALAAQIDTLAPDEVVEVEKLLGELEEKLARERASNDLIAFCQYMDPKYIVGRHHRVLADRLMALESGEKDRALVNMPPRHGKSQIASIYFPAWFIGRNPAKQIMMVSHTTDLAVDFGRKVRNLVDDTKFQEIFPEIHLAADSKSAGRWNTNKGGTYYATGVGSSLAGRGADMLIVDDAHSEQDILNGNFEIFDKAYQWFTFGARTRLMPQGAVAIIQTRWHMEDLSGRLVRDMAQNEGADQYDVVEFPAILEVKQADGSIVEKALWPEFFDLEALHRTRASMAVFQWNAQYQQQPTAESSALVKREWWRAWKEEEPPEVEYVIMALDTAAEAKQRADYTALTVWGVFFNEDEHMNQLILLEAIRKRVEFPELKILAQEQYRIWTPDAFIVEKKSSGVALYQELRRTGLPIQEYTPHRGSGSKYARLQSVADIISSGVCWVPETRWAEELVEEMASFPVGAHDDLCLVAGTRIRMADGAEKRIECVRIGEMVHTPAGPRPVSAAGYTGVHETLTLTCSVGSITGTGGHLVATTSGWKRLDTMAITDTIKVSQQGALSWLGQLIRVYGQSLLSSTDTLITATRIRVMPRTGGIFPGQADTTCTAPSGSLTTGLFPTGTTSITETKTGTTTTSRISSACQSRTTAPCTHSSHPSSTNDPSSLNTSPASGRRLPSGTARRRGALGIARSLVNLLRRAERATWLESGSWQSKLLTRPLALASNVAALFCRRLARRISARRRAHVGCIGAGSGKKPVYNLSVAGARCYYANGILVHNCDSTVMALMRFRQGGFLTLKSDNEFDNTGEYVPYRAAYY